MQRTPAAPREHPQPTSSLRGSDSGSTVGGPYAYYVLGVLFVVYIFNFIDRQILAILLQPIKEDLKISDTALGFPAASIVQDLVPPAMRAVASAVFIFILTIIGLGAGPQVIGILNDWIGTPDAIRYSLLYVAVTMNLLSAWFFWRTGKTLAQDLEAKRKL